MVAAIFSTFVVSDPLQAGCISVPDGRRYLSKNIAIAFDEALHPDQSRFRSSSRRPSFPQHIRGIRKGEPLPCSKPHLGIGLIDRADGKPMRDHPVAVRAAVFRIDERSHDRVGYFPRIPASSKATRAAAS